MHHTVDATQEDMGPIRDNQIQMSLYYVCFVVVFSFFFLNMFVALIIVTFQEQGEKEMDGCELDRNQVIRSLRTVPTIVTAHTFCASRDTRVSYGWCLLIQGYFCAV